MPLPCDPFGRTGDPPPMAMDRADRVALLGQAFEALERGQLPPDRARKFLAESGLAWLRQGGSLERDHLQVAAPRASTATPTKLWLKLAHRDERQESEKAAE